MIDSASLPADQPTAVTPEAPSLSTPYTTPRSTPHTTPQSKASTPPRSRSPSPSAASSSSSTSTCSSSTSSGEEERLRKAAEQNSGPKIFRRIPSSTPSKASRESPSEAPTRGLHRESSGEQHLSAESTSQGSPTGQSQRQRKWKARESSAPRSGVMVPTKRTRNEGPMPVGHFTSGKGNAKAVATRVANAGAEAEERSPDRSRVDRAKKENLPPLVPRKDVVKKPTASRQASQSPKVHNRPVKRQQAPGPTKPKVSKLEDWNKRAVVTGSKEFEKVEEWKKGTVQPEEAQEAHSLADASPQPSTQTALSHDPPEEKPLGAPPASWPEDFERELPPDVVRKLKKDLARKMLSVGETACEDPAAGFQINAEMEKAAQEALEADSRCQDQEAVQALQAAILAHIAYRVPTGSDFWDRVEQIKAGKSRANVMEVLRKYKRDAVATPRALDDHLARLYVCCGRKLELMAHTSPDLGFAEELESLAARRTSSISDLSESSDDKGGEEYEGDLGECTDALQKLSVPQVPPGWLLARDTSDPSEVWVSVAGTQNLNDCFRDCLFVPADLELPSPSAPGADTDTASSSSYTDSEGDDTPKERAGGDGWQVHMGFLDGAKRIFPQISAALGNIRHPIKLNLTGHSLGGATALLLAVFFRCAALPNISVGKVITFGAPNVFCTKDWRGDAPAVLKGLDIRQYVNNKDIVPRALGAPLIKKLTKAFIRLGVKALSSVTSDNANCMLHYRFVSPYLYHITPPYGVVKVGAKDEMKSLLGVSLMDCGPSAVQDHKLAGYISRLLLFLDAHTNHKHTYSTDSPTSESDFSANPIAGVVFDKKDSSVLSTPFVNALDDIFDRIRKADGGVDDSALRALFDWSGRVYPLRLIHANLLSGVYEITDDGCLTRGGWHAMIEDTCYNDLPWVVRMLQAMGWTTEGTKLVKGRMIGADRKRETFPDPLPAFDAPPLVDTHGVLSPAAAHVADLLFTAYSRVLPSDIYKRRNKESAEPVMRFECLQAFLSNCEVAVTGEQLSYKQSSAMASAAITAARTANPTNVDASGGLRKAGFLQLLVEWMTEDEVRVWGIFRGLGFPEDPTDCTTIPRVEAAQVHVEDEPGAATGAGKWWGRCTCFIRDKELREEKKRRRQLYREELQKHLYLAWKEHKRIPSAEALAEANNRLEEEIGKIKSALAAALSPKSEMSPEKMHRAAEAIAKNNEKLHSKVEELEDATAAASRIQELMSQQAALDEEIHELSKANRRMSAELRLNSKVLCADTPKHKILALQSEHQQEIALLRKQLTQVAKDRQQCETTLSNQARLIEDLSSKAPDIDVKVLKQLLSVRSEQKVRRSALMKELAVLRRAEASNKKRHEQYRVDTTAHIDQLKRQLATLDLTLKIKSRAIASNQRATRAGRQALKQLHPVGKNSPYLSSPI